MIDIRLKLIAFFQSLSKIKSIAQKTERVGQMRNDQLRNEIYCTEWDFQLYRSQPTWSFRNDQKLTLENKVWLEKEICYSFIFSFNPEAADKINQRWLQLAFI